MDFVESGLKSSPLIYSYPPSILYVLHCHSVLSFRFAFQFLFATSTISAMLDTHHPYIPPFPLVAPCDLMEPTPNGIRSTYSYSIGYRKRVLCLFFSRLNSSRTQIRVYNVVHMPLNPPRHINLRALRVGR